MKKQKPIRTMVYSTPKSVKAMIDYRRDGRGIMNTENGLFVNGVIYPKGTAFRVGPGYFEESLEEDTNQ